MSRHASVQTAHLNVEMIEDDVVRLIDGQHRAVLEIGSVNFGLQDEREQESLVVGYAGFLNSLSFPVQILVRVVPIDIGRYLDELERHARHSLSEDVAQLARDHITFVRRLAHQRTLLERRFYLIVPAHDNPPSKRPSWPFVVRLQSGPDAAAVGRQLMTRCEEIERQLGRSGLSVRRLTSVEIAQLLYACWCPELARGQRLQRTFAEYDRLVVQAMSPSRRRS